MALAIAGLILGAGLIAGGIDGAFTRAGAARVVCGLLPPIGLALAALAVLRLCVPGFYAF